MPKLKTGTLLPTEEEDARIREGISADPDTYEIASPAEWAEMKPFQLPGDRLKYSKERHDLIAE